MNKISGADENLRREVGSLLDFENDSEDFLDTPPEWLAAEMFAERKSAASPVGRQINHYKIKKLLGKGGMGEVYLAEDLTLEREVALKILPVQFTANADRLNRFVREAKAASALNHPNIITIYEIGKSDALNFIATEFIEGETLRERQGKVEISFAEQLSIVIQTADALAAARAAGIVHRDIKPENIMIRHDGYVKVLDFGLAKLAQSRNPNFDSEAETRALALTMPGMIMGTAAYMSPEQTRSLATVDARTDVWSLGVVIYEMFAGRVPFAGETNGDLIAAVLKTEAPHLSEIFSECPPELNRIVAKTLQKDREERYQVIKDLALDLKGLRKEMDFSSLYPLSKKAPNNQTEQIERQSTKIDLAPRFSVFGIFSIALLILATVGAFWWFYGRTQTSSIMPDAALKTTEVFNWASTPGEGESIGSFSPDGKMIAFSSTKNGGKNVWIKQTSSGEAVQITKDEYRNQNPIWSPNGEELAYFSTKGNQTGFWRVPALGGMAKLISTIDDGSSLLKFWSEQNLVYFESENELYALDAASGQSKKVTDFGRQNISAQSISISPDEKSIAYLTIDGDQWSVWAENVDDKKSVKIFSSANEIKNTVWHPDNQRIFFSSIVDGTFQIFVTDTKGALPKQITTAEKDSFVVNVSADGTKILYGSAKEESDIWGYNVKENKEFNATSGIDSELWANVSPDGKSIVYQSIKNLSQGNNLFFGKIFTKNLQSENEPVEIVPQGYLPVWSSDGQKIAFMNVVGQKNQISIINTAQGGQKYPAADDVTSIYYSLLPYDRIQSNDFGWSPDSRKIAYISKRSGQNNIWIVNNGAC